MQVLQIKLGCTIKRNACLVCSDKLYTKLIIQWNCNKLGHETQTNFVEKKWKWGKFVNKTEKLCNKVLESKLWYKVR